MEEKVISKWGSFDNLLFQSKASVFSKWCKILFQCTTVVSKGCNYFKVRLDNSTSSVMLITGCNFNKSGIKWSIHSRGRFSTLSKHLWSGFLAKIVKEARHNFCVHRSGHLFIIAISSRNHKERKQTQAIIFQYSWFVSLIKIVKNMWRKIHKLGNTLIWTSKDS